MATTPIAQTDLTTAVSNLAAAVTGELTAVNKTLSSSGSTVDGSVPADVVEKAVSGINDVIAQLNSATAALQASGTASTGSEVHGGVIPK